MKNLRRMGKELKLKKAEGKHEGRSPTEEKEVRSDRGGHCEGERQLAQLRVIGGDFFKTAE